MMFPKSPRIKNPKIAKQLKTEIGYCELCGSQSFLEAHHCKSRGAGGGDTRENLIVLCYLCHRQAHNGKIAREVLSNIVHKRERGNNYGL